MKIFLDTIGCRLNQSEIEGMAGQFRANGHEIVESAAESDLVVVNTCAVTGEAASDSRQAVRRAARQQKNGRIVVTGCWATLDPQGAAELPNVIEVVVNAEKDALVRRALHLPEDRFVRTLMARQPLPGGRMRTRAFLKAQDGCDNACTYCVTRVARGRSQSRCLEDILQDGKSALEGGVKEIVLTGVHLGSWGLEFTPPQRIGDLVHSLLARLEAPRLRLSSLEPWDLDEDFFSLWRDRRLCRHLHLPLQSGSEAVLRRMGRRTTPEEYLRLVEAARRASPEMSITTDMMVGFPGEGEAEFEETLAFVRRVGFSGGHVFNFSARPGTAAEKLCGAVSLAIRKERSSRLRALFAELEEEHRRRCVGMQADVLWEGSIQHPEGGWRVEGLSDTYIRVKARAPLDLHNQVSRVRLAGLLPQGMRGDLT